MGKRRIELRVNGEVRMVEAYPMARLLDVLREEIGLTGTKEGCGEGECGACAVLVDGELVNSCLVPALQAAGSDVLTIEGLEKKDGLKARRETATCIRFRKLSPKPAERNAEYARRA